MNHDFIQFDIFISVFILVSLYFSKKSIIQQKTHTLFLIVYYFACALQKKIRRKLKLNKNENVMSALCKKRVKFVNEAKTMKGIHTSKGDISTYLFKTKTLKSKKSEKLKVRF